MTFNQTPPSEAPFNFKRIMGLPYRAFAKFGNMIDFYLSPTRNAKATRRFLDKILKSAYVTIKGSEVMHALCKGQAASFNLTGDIRGEAQLAERDFSVEQSALAEATTCLLDISKIQLLKTEITEFRL